jgi:hypothetical protein
VIKKRGAIASWRHLVPAGFMLAIMVSICLAILTWQPVWLWIVAAPYAGANLAASLWTARQDWRLLPLLPLVFLTLHASYGLGFLWGVWQWGVVQSMKTQHS